MKRFLSMVIAATISVLLFTSPMPQKFTLAVSQTNKHLDVRLMNYVAYAERFDTSSSYRDIIARTPKNVVNLYYMGSSDVTHGALANPEGFITKYLPGFDLYLSGRPYAQSLFHAIELGAVAADIPNKKVVFHPSPQHFSIYSPVPEGFRSVFSWSNWSELMANDAVPVDLKKRILDRAIHLFPELCTKYAQCGPQTWKSRATTFVKSMGSGPAIKLNMLAELNREKTFSTKYIGPYSGPNIAPKPIPAKWWEERLTDFLAISKTQSTNPFTIPDYRWHGNLDRMVVTDKGKHANVGYGDSDEYKDFQLFLEMAKALNIEVLIALTPPNGKWLEVTGMKPEKKAEYYTKIRAMVSTYPNVKLADFSSHEYEDYFFEDHMHLWMTGWTHLMRACYEFALK